MPRAAAPAARQPGRAAPARRHRAPRGGGTGATLKTRPAPRLAGPAPPSRAEWTALALVLLAAVWLHSGALRAPFLADDYLFLDQARGRSLWETLVSPDPIGNYYRPVSRQLWFWCLARAGGESPLVFHAANLAVFLGILALLFAIARRLIGSGPAIVATSIVAASHAADVPVLWASGSQDLLAALGALAAIQLYAVGRRWWAAGAVLVALLSKETALFAPLVAVLVARRPERGPRALARAWPLVAALGLWAVAWLLTASRRPGLGAEARLDPAGIPATLVHLAQTVIGVEWPSEGLAAWLAAPPAILAAIAVAVWLAGRRAPSSHRAPAGAPGGSRRPGRPDKSRGPGRPGSAAGSAALRHALIAGLAWAVLAALPVAAVARIWSAYQYLFAVCGAAVGAAALLARHRRWVGLAAVALLVWASGNTRRLREFALPRSPWTTQSHVNRHYLERGMTVAARYLGDLRGARPALPPNGTLFFAGLPAQIGFQAGDGALIRWAYRDSSLRSYFLTQFRLESARRGPVFFFQSTGGGLAEIDGPDSLERIGFALVLSDAPEAARDALWLAWERTPDNPEIAFQLAWTSMALGDTGAAAAWLARCGVAAEPGPAPEVPAALARIAAGDTAAARALAHRSAERHGLDPGAHALVADIALSSGDLRLGTLSAYAARVLAPEDPSAWRRWGLVQAVQMRDRQAAAALERYLELAGAQGRADREILEVLSALRRRLPGGDIAQRELRTTGRESRSE